MANFDFDIKLGLESITELCNILGNPQDSFKSIHITGTNGKGSVGAFIESILIQQGYTVGRYTSPAVDSIFDTITINRVSITPNDYNFHLDKVLKACEGVVQNGIRKPSKFEIDTAVAFDYLSTRCDIALIEVGMGGRLDATNVLHNKILSVITSISLDHTQFLGDTLEKITIEKCGIIQEGVPTVTISQCDEVIRTIERVCKSKNSKLSIANSKDIQNVRLSNDYTLTFDYLNTDSKYSKYIGLKSKLIGDFQTDNAIVSIKACEVLEIFKESIVQGIYNAVWKHRFEVINTNPLVILDGCHNVDASKRLRKSIDTYFKGKSICYIMGIFKDKDYNTIAKNLCDRADMIYTISTDGNRSLSAENLANVVRKYNPNVVACNTVSQAIEESKRSHLDVTIVFGSLSTLSQFNEF